METNDCDIDLLISELQFQTSRSGGKGGQHVNKTESKVQLFFDVNNSKILSAEQKTRILKNAASYLTQGQILLLSCESSRSQHINKAEVIEQFIRIIVEAVKEPKQRKQTKVPNIEKEKRLKAKKTQSNKKQNRQNPDLSELI
jgi:ribosome-associated protein